MNPRIRRRLVIALTTAVVAGVTVASTSVALAATTPDAGSKFVPAPVASGEPQPVPDSFIVELPAHTSGDETQRLARELSAKYGVTTEHVYDAGYKGFSVKGTASQAQLIARDTAVSAVTQDVYMSIDALGVQANPPSWGLDRIDERSLPRDFKYHYPQTAPSVVAFVIDTGIRLSHQEFSPGRAVCGWDPFFSGCAPCNQYHGTHVAGTVGGNSVGVAKQVKIVSVKVFNCSGSTPASVVLAGVNYVTFSAQLNPSVRMVANMSLGGGSFPPLVAAVNASIAANVHYSVAAGNSNANACLFSPANVTNATTVGATDVNDNRASFSNFGTCVDVFAPGVGIYSAWHTADNAYGSLSGTSMASPHAAGTAAMWRQKFPGDNAIAVANAINGNATPGVVVNPGLGSPNRLLFMGMIPV